MEQKCREHFVDLHGDRADGKGDLARIMSQEDNNKVAAVLSDAGHTACVWLGGGTNDRLATNNWHWGDFAIIGVWYGERNPYTDIAMTYTNWRVGEEQKNAMNVMQFCPSDNQWISLRLDGTPPHDRADAVCMLSCDGDVAVPRRLSENQEESQRPLSVQRDAARPRRRLLTGDPNPYSRFPGDARDSRPLPNVQQIFVRDFNLDGKPDLFLHAPALSPGSCAQRCHSLGRFGYDSFKVHRAGYRAHYPQEDVHEHSYCYCGPAYQLMIAPHPPPSPPKPPPSPFEPPSIPPIQSPGMPPPSPPFPVYRAAGM